MLESYLFRAAGWLARNDAVRLAVHGAGESPASAQSLKRIFEAAKLRLNSTVSSPLPFKAFRTPVLSTRDGGRTVVLRNVLPSERDPLKRRMSLVAHTHSMSSKVAEIKDRPYSQWCFYDNLSLVQIRCSGPTDILQISSNSDRNIVEEEWKRAVKAMYILNSRPGSVIGSPVSAINDAVTDTGLSENKYEDQSVASSQFAVVRTLVEEFNVLVLSREGNKQFVFSVSQRPHFLEFQDDSGVTVWGAEIVP
jgi:hypothetical protein